MTSESDQQTVEVSLDPAVYSLTAVKKAAYACSAFASVEISISEGTINCVLHWDTSESSERIESRFRVEVLDQDLRELISRETAPIRNAILAHAFSKTGLQQ